MQDTEHINFIADCLTNYKIKIQALNKAGLFDSAKLFEYFALEICRLWFKQNFHNLNEIQANYPYVDLVSEDGQIYVQVSTVQDIPAKIKSTLDKISTSKIKDVAKIKQVYFFVLGNESAEKVVDYQVGDISFKADQHLKTLSDVNVKARADKDFRRELYHLLKQELTNYTQNEAKLADAVEASKLLISGTIDDLLNGEYEIERQPIIVQIKEENKKYITILGDAGSGKTALCKKLLKDEKIILYARAEKLAEAIHLNDVWDLDIKKTLHYLNNKKITFFIDALEFVADCRSIKVELLQQLYEAARQHDNAFIVTTCRTADSNAFLKIGNHYDVQNYLIPDLTDAEINKVAEKYPLIRDMQELKGYMQLLRNPFYLNLIVSNIHSVDDIRDVNNLRDRIWHKQICLEERNLPANLQKNDIRNCVQKIVFERARNFLTGVAVDTLNTDAVKVLDSAGVVVLTGDKVRLKYDIYEDICFEKRIDECFDFCRGNFKIFFEDIEKLGRCVYRRFQIWVENKLFIKNNLKKFLYQLIFADTIPAMWKEQTIIGIVKSRFCHSFFENYGKQIIENNLLEEFLKVVNLFSFEVNNYKIDGDNIITFLKPVGVGRQCLLQLIIKYDIYKQQDYRKSIVKLCTDYANITKFTNSLDVKPTVSACEIMEFYIENEIKSIKTGASYLHKSNICQYLTPVYFLANHAGKWLKDFLQNVCTYYQSNDSTEHLIGEEIINHTLRNTTIALVLYCSAELSQMAFLYWTFQWNPDRQDLFFINRYGSSQLGQEGIFGFNKHARQYRCETYLFFIVLCRYNINKALTWLIKIANYATDRVKSNRPQDVSEITILVNKDGRKKTFIGSMSFWMAGRQDGAVPDLLGDCFCLIKQYIFDLFDNTPLQLTKEEMVHLANRWKQEILICSNNIMLLTLIEEIGKRYNNMLPGYALELVSSMELLLMDIERSGLFMGTPLIQGFQNTIFKTMGLPDFKERFKQDASTAYSFQDYVLMSQISNNPDCKQKAESILGYLYSIIPNNKEHALEYMQIQKMDAKNAAIEKQPVEGDNKTLIQVTPVLTGMAEDLAKGAADNPLAKVLSRWTDIRQSIEAKCKSGYYTKEECLSDIDRIAAVVSGFEYGFLAEKHLFEMIVYALTGFELSTEERSGLCDAWIAGITKILDGKSMQFEEESVIVLFKQIEQDLKAETVVNLKQLMLALLLNQDHNGRIWTFNRMLKRYLKGNKRIAKALFNTVVTLAEDEMKHNLFNANYWAGKDADYTYVPNRQSPFRNVDALLINNEESGFQSQYDVLVEKYLVNEDELEIINFNMEQYDIGVLCFISQCGLQLDDKEFRTVLTALVNETVEILNSVKRTSDYFNYSQQHEISGFLSQALVSDGADIVTSILFEGKDFSKYSSDTYDFYYSVAGLLLPSFFDGYKDKALRVRCKKSICVLENKINTLADEKAKRQFSKMLLLTLGAYGDWSKLEAGYEYEDKMFLTDIWYKYGVYHLKELIEVVYQMQYKKLLPEVLRALNHCFAENEGNEKLLGNVIVKEELLIKIIVTKAFFEFSDAIKQDAELTEAYENLLEILVKYEMEEAGVFLDEFRVH